MGIWVRLCFSPDMCGDAGSVVAAITLSDLGKLVPPTATVPASTFALGAVHSIRLPSTETGT